jgi:organic hydroperoxide reductase OsmC/OhrA
MRIVAKVANAFNTHSIQVATDGVVRAISIGPKPSGFGSSVNGGELLFLALATCYCNDLYREAAARGMRIEAVEVEVRGDFGGRGEPAKAITYRANVKSEASEADISQLLADTDRVAEIQNTLRSGCTVTLEKPS